MNTLGAYRMKAFILILVLLTSANFHCAWANYANKKGKIQREREYSTSEEYRKLNVTSLASLAKTPNPLNRVAPRTHLQHPEEWKGEKKNPSRPRSCIDRQHSVP